MEVLPRREAAPALEHREHLLARRARVRGRLEDDELAGPEAGRELLRGRDEDAEVRLALARERCRERDQDRVRVAQHVVVRGRADAAFLDERQQPLRGHVLDVALAPVQLLDARGVDVDEHDRLPRLGEGLGERDADIAGSDDGDVALHGPGIVLTSTLAILAEARPSP